MVKVGIIGIFSKFQTLMESFSATVTAHGATEDVLLIKLGTMTSLMGLVCPSTIDTQAGELQNLNLISSPQCSLNNLI